MNESPGRTTTTTTRNVANEVTRGALVGEVNKTSVSGPRASSIGNVNADGVAQSISTGAGGGYSDGRYDGPILGTPLADAIPHNGPTTRQPMKKSGYLKIDVPVESLDPRRKPDVSTLNPKRDALRDKPRTKDNHPPEKRSDLTPRDKRLDAWCRERPKDNKPKEDAIKSGGGGGSRFRPWVGTKGARC